MKGFSRSLINRFGEATWIMLGWLLYAGIILLPYLPLAPLVGLLWPLCSLALFLWWLVDIVDQRVTFGLTLLLLGGSFLPHGMANGALTICWLIYWLLLRK
jgi:hypothetical protein